MNLETSPSSEKKISSEVLDESLKMSTANLDDINHYKRIQASADLDPALNLYFIHYPKTKTIYIRDIQKTENFKNIDLSLNYLISAFEALHTYSVKNDINTITYIPANDTLRKFYHRLRKRNREKAKTTLSLKERIIHRINNIYPSLQETWSTLELGELIESLKRFPKKTKA